MLCFIWNWKLVLSLVSICQIGTRGTYCFCYFDARNFSYSHHLIQNQSFITLRRHLFIMEWKTKSYEGKKEVYYLVDRLLYSFWIWLNISQYMPCLPYAVVVFVLPLSPQHYKTLILKEERVDFLTVSKFSRDPWQMFRVAQEMIINKNRSYLFSIKVAICMNKVFIDNANCKRKFCLSLSVLHLIHPGLMSQL